MDKNPLNLTLQLALQQQQQHEQQAAWYPHDSTPSSMAMASAAAVLLPPLIPSMPASLAAMGTFGQQNRMPNQSISPIFNTNAAVMENANMMMMNNITHHSNADGLHLGNVNGILQNSYHSFSPIPIPYQYRNTFPSTTANMAINNVNTENPHLDCTGRPMQNTSLQSALPTPKASELSCIAPPQMTLGRESFEHTEAHTTLVYQTVLQFFGVGQKKPLKRFCIDAEVERSYQSIRRCIENNPTLNQLRSAPHNIDGFSSKVSKEAAATISSMQHGSPSSHEMDVIITQEICIGMVHKAATTAMESNPTAVLQIYDVSKGVCRSKQCLDVVPPNKVLALRSGWKETHGRWQCPKCFNADSNVHRNEKKLKAPPRMVTPISSQSDLKKAIKGLHRNHKKGATGQVDLRKLLLEDDRLVKYFRMLIVLNGNAVVEFDDDTSIRLCIGCNRNKPPCEELIFVKSKSTNSGRCGKCTIAMANQVRAEKTREMNYAKQVAPNSRTKESALTEEQKREKHKNSALLIGKLNRKVARLEKKLKAVKARLVESCSGRGCSEMTEEVVNHEHKKFKEDLKGKMEHVLDNFGGTYQKMLSESLYTLVEHGINNEKKKNDYEFQREDVQELVSFLKCQLTNQVKILAGKETGQRFCPTTWQITQALCSNSMSNFCQFKENSPLNYPSESSCRKFMKENKVSDGRGTQAYENRLATKRAEAPSTEEGTPIDQAYGMCDEIHTKNQVNYHSATGQAIGLENDELDITTVLHRMLSKEQGSVQKTQKANLWLIVVFRAGRFRSWIAAYYFNNGTLSGETLLNQFRQVVINCETVGTQILGLVLDAGGCNANFIMYLRDMMKLSDDVCWLKDEECYIKNPMYPERRIYFYFCVTHLFKAVRNQLLASQPDGAKAFIDKNGVAFGWALIPESFHKKENLPHADINANKLNRLTDQVVYPMREKKMNVGIAKVPFEHELGAYHINEKCKELNITYKQLTEATADEVAKLPFAKTISKDKHHPFHRLGQHVVQVRYLQRLARSQEETRVETQLVLQDMVCAVEFDVAGDNNVLTSQSLGSSTSFGSNVTDSNTILGANINAVIDTNNTSSEPPSLDNSVAVTNFNFNSNSDANIGPELPVAGEKSPVDDNSDSSSVGSADNSDCSSVSSIMSDIQSLGEFSDDGVDWQSDEIMDFCNVESKSKVQHTYDRVAQDRHQTPTATTSAAKIHSDLSTMEYLAVNEAMFTYLLMSKEEKFTMENHEIYMNFLKWLMTYYQDWKLAQLERRRTGLPQKVWEPSFLAYETWRNMRIAVCGFTHFSKYVLGYLPTQIEGWKYIQMQINNQTPVEGTFSIFRRIGLDNQNMGKAVSNHSSRSLAKATKDNSYDENDLPEMEDGKIKSGKSLFTKFGRDTTTRVIKLIALRTSVNQQGVSRFGEGVIHKSRLLCLLGRTMQSHPLEGSFLDLLVNNKDFQGYIRLCVLDDVQMKWFQSFVTADENEVDIACQTILRTLFSLVEDSCHGIKPAFEKAYMDFMMSEEFQEFYESKLPENTRGNRQGAIYLLETLKYLFDEWYFDALSELVGPNFDEESEAHLDDESYLINVQLMVGGAMPKLKKKIGSSIARSVIDSMSFQQFKGDVDGEYLDEFVPQVLQHTDKVGLSLIKRPFIPFAKALLKFCQDANSERERYKNRNDWIRVGLDTVRKDETLLSQFKEIVLTEVSAVDELLICAMYKRVAEYTMRAYSKFTKDRVFNIQKTQRLDTSNVKFRTLIQTGSKSAGKSKSKKKREKKKSLYAYMVILNARYAAKNSPPEALPASDAASSNPNSNIAVGNSLGPDAMGDESSNNVAGVPTIPPLQTLPATAASTKQRKKVRKTDDDFKQSYRDVYEEALPKFNKILQSKNRKVGNLRGTLCLSILLVKFNIYLKECKTNKSKVIRLRLQREIDAQANNTSNANEMNTNREL